ACPPEVSPSLWEVRPIAYPLGSATYRLPSRKCDHTPDYTGKIPDYKRSQRDRRTLLKETVMVQFKANK
ncbi:hypothetical protein, partial [Limnospira sp. Paracas R14]|uniref:hypothetical protein n=1 Tax=Limnospira sp. Paracas R14 TaxID=2981108 RepID=UPI0028E0C68F|nr:hypothetical protein [Limnospira sp. Paracas R14]